MTENVSNTVDSEEDGEWSVTDPAAVAERHGVTFERRTYDHDNAEHCETDAVGRAIVGMTDTAGRVLVVVQPEECHAVLPNETVDPGEDWATVGRELIEEMAGVGARFADVRLVREVEHRVAGEARSTTHHVVFGGSLADSDPPLDGLCDDAWELRWIDAIPAWLDDDAEGVYADIELFVGVDHE